MKRTYRKRKTYKKRKTFKKRRNGGSFKGIAPLSTGFPRKLKINHRYCDRIVATSTSGVPNIYVMSWNSLFDPNVTGTGHQPYYFDQVAAIYNHYYVIGARAKVTVIPSNGSQTSFYTCCFTDDDSTTTNGTQLQSVIEMNNSTVVRGLSALGGNTTVHRQTWSAKKRFGRNILGNFSLAGNSGSSPAEQEYFKIALQAADGATTVSAVYIIEMTYTTVWTETLEVPSS